MSEEIKKQDLDPIFPLLRGEFMEALKDKTIEEAIRYLYQQKQKAMNGERFTDTQGDFTDDFPKLIEADGREESFRSLFRILRLGGFQKEDIRNYFHDTASMKLSTGKLVHPKKQDQFEVKILTDNLLEEIFGKTVH